MLTVNVKAGDSSLTACLTSRALVTQPDAVYPPENNWRVTVVRDGDAVTRFLRGRVASRGVTEAGRMYRVLVAGQ